MPSEPAKARQLRLGMNEKLSRLGPVQRASNLVRLNWICRMVKGFLRPDDGYGPPGVVFWAVVLPPGGATAFGGDVGEGLEEVIGGDECGM